MASSGIQQHTFYSGEFTFKLEWSQSNQSIVDNTSTLNWTLSLVDNANNGTTMYAPAYTGIEWTNYIELDGTSYKLPDTFEVADGGSLVLGSGSQEVTHLADGTKTVSYNFDVYVGYQYGSNPFKSYSGTFELDPISRQAVITSAEDFNDEENPTITYIAPSTATSLQACISFSGGNDDIAYRDIPINETSYTFNLTQAERNVLYTKLDEGLTMTSVRFYIKSVVNGQTFYSYLAKTLTFVNYHPSLNPYIYDSNARAVTLTGSDQKFIKYISNATFTTGATANKGASVSSQYIKNGTQTAYNTSSGTLEAITSNTFYLSVTDNRGYTKSEAVVYSIDNSEFIEYVKLTCSAKAGEMNAEGTIQVTVSGKYWNGFFGAVQNSLELEYGLKENNGDIVWTRLGTVTPTVDSNYNYSYTFTITGLNYLSVYELTVNAIDEAMPQAAVATTVLASTPVFDWSRDDFNFNVPVTVPAVNGVRVGENKVLWEGSYWMQSGHSVTLSERISAQPNGIVLVFSGFNTTNSTALDSSFNSFFVSKKEVELMPYKAHSFIMLNNAGFSKIGAKYLTINDTTITGYNDTNKATGSNNGITYDNSYFVLRYVIGV